MLKQTFQQEQANKAVSMVRCYTLDLDHIQYDAVMNGGIYLYNYKSPISGVVFYQCFNISEILCFSSNEYTEVTHEYLQTDVTETDPHQDSELLQSSQEA